MYLAFAKERIIIGSALLFQLYLLHQIFLTLSLNGRFLLIAKSRRCCLILELLLRGCLDVLLVNLVLGVGSFSKDMLNRRQPYRCEVISFYSWESMSKTVLKTCKDSHVLDISHSLTAFLYVLPQDYIYSIYLRGYLYYIVLKIL